MKEFFRMSFQTVNFLVIAIHALSAQLPELVNLAINELKKLFEEEKPQQQQRSRTTKK